MRRVVSWRLTQADLARCCWRVRSHNQAQRNEDQALKVSDETLQAEIQWRSKPAGIEFTVMATFLAFA